MSCNKSPPAPPRPHRQSSNECTSDNEVLTPTSTCTEVTSDDSPATFYVKHTPIACKLTAPVLKDTISLNMIIKHFSDFNEKDMHYKGESNLGSLLTDR